MKYTDGCVKRLTKDILPLVERLHSLHNTIEGKENGVKSEKERDLHKNNLENLIDESCSLEESAMSQSVLDIDTKQSDSFLQFDSFFNDEKSKQYNKK